MLENGQKFREVAGRFATGVAVVTTRLGTDAHGMTVNSFCSVSLDPPLILFCAQPASRTASLIQKSGIFAVSILAVGQQDLSSHFASVESEASDRLAAQDVFTRFTGCPILKDCLAWLDCTLEALHPGGDHVIFVGRVMDLDVRDANGHPLIFHASRYRSLQQ